MMFTKQELAEIKDAINIVYKTIRPDFGTMGGSDWKDARAARTAACRFVAAKLAGDK